MKNSRQMLGSILKTAQMGQVGVQTALERTMGPRLRKALESQLQEYATLEYEALAIAGQRGWDLPELDPAVRYLSNLRAGFQLGHNSSDGKIADMVIQGNTRGMARADKIRNRLSGQDPQVHILFQKLLDCETANIRQMRNFL